MQNLRFMPMKELERVKPLQRLKRLVPVYQVNKREKEVPKLRVAVAAGSIPPPGGDDNLAKFFKQPISKAMLAKLQQFSNNHFQKFNYYNKNIAKK